MIKKVGKEIWTIDNFYEDFDAVRAMALRARYEKRPGGLYWGRNSLDAYYPHELFDKVRPIIGHFHISHVDTPTYNPHSTGKFRRAFARDHKENGQIHCDYQGAYSCAVYLNTPEQCEGRLGTDFWRHKRSGNTKGYRYDWERKHNFEIYYQTQLKPNRAVLFNAELMHSIHENFGDTLETARLIHIFFLFPGHSKDGLNCC